MSHDGLIRKDLKGCRSMLVFVCFCLLSWFQSSVVSIQASAGGSGSARIHRIKCLESGK
jgi:hypothetical protein